MYLNYAESVALARELRDMSFDSDRISIIIFPTALAFVGVAEVLRGTAISVGAQTVNWTPKGAYTGAISAHLFADAGCRYALVGHSERRYIFGEKNEDVHKKIDACLDADITPILCIGETAADREEGKTKYRLKKQLVHALKGRHFNGQSLFVAYEPVWAVGTGEPCDPDTVDEMHYWLRDELKQLVDVHVPLLYGGSVNAENVLSYVSRESIDGVLPGGASKSFDTFSALVHEVEQLS